MKKDFVYKGLECFLNSNHIWKEKYDYEFTPKYTLLIKRGGSYIPETHVDTKKEALQYMKENYIYIINR